jgi:ArsR family transcriptional regulator, arsenate/arsenite/antimonite-responsive transcriptional repressor
MTVPKMRRRSREKEATAVIIGLTGASRELLTEISYFYYNRNMERIAAKALPVADRTATYADMFAAIGSEPRLRILRVLLAAHPEGMVVGEIQNELDIAPSTLSHHLEKLKNENLIAVRRESTFLRYTANTTVLEELLGFLYAECCTRNKAIKPAKITQLCR